MSLGMLRLARAVGFGVGYAAMYGFMWLLHLWAPIPMLRPLEVFGIVMASYLPRLIWNGEVKMTDNALTLGKRG